VLATLGDLGNLISFTLLCVFDFFFDTGSYFVAQAGLELTILLPLPPEC
jgi:hypothetical protein